MARLAAALLAAAAAGAHAANLRMSLRSASRNATSMIMIPGTDIVMPPDYEDYTRGRKTLDLYPSGKIPGTRTSAMAPGLGCPSFDAAHPQRTPEAFVDASPMDFVGARCAPGGDAAGHYFYNVVEPTMVAYVVPEGTPGRKDAAVVIAPGGGGIHLAWEPEGVSTAEWLNSHGISAFILKYRVPDHSYMLMLQDAQRALSLVRARAADYGLNASRVGFFGGSAGGKMGLMVSTRGSRTYSRIDEIDDLDFRPNFLIALYPAVDLDMPGKVSELPPTFLSFSEDDPCCPAVMAHALERAGHKFAKSPFVSKSYRRGKHGWGGFEYYPVLKDMEVCTWRDHALQFLTEHVLAK
mmetsp:Transcript_79400/g.179144  ORF Transcript_79400/g.179144 Transcript_79400/m.179144 type:complete len:352 (+) Transcript_79400:64-1119(+)